MSFGMTFVRQAVMPQTKNCCLAWLSCVRRSCRRRKFVVWHDFRASGGHAAEEKFVVWYDFRASGGHAAGENLLFGMTFVRQLVMPSGFAAHYLPYNSSALYTVYPS